MKTRIYGLIVSGGLLGGLLLPLQMVALAIFYDDAFPVRLSGSTKIPLYQVLLDPIMRVAAVQRLISDLWYFVPLGAVLGGLSISLWGAWRRQDTRGLSIVFVSSSIFAALLTVLTSVLFYFLLAVDHLDRLSDVIFDIVANVPLHWAVLLVIISKKALKRLNPKVCSASST